VNATQLQSVEIPATPTVSAQKTLRPLFAVGGLYSTANGVAWIMRDLASALGRIGAPVTVCAADCIGRESVGHIFAPPTRWVTAPGRWLGGLSLAPKLKPILEREIAKADIVHNHSLWMLPTSYASRSAEHVKKPVVFTAHGTLEPWALAHSGWKKRLVGCAFQNRDLSGAACIHVNSRAEVAGIRAYGLKNPLAVVPNGVDLTPFAQIPTRAVFDDIYPHLANKRICLFLSRLHKKKGLGHLIPAWRRVTKVFPEWHLMIAGRDDGYEDTLRRLVCDLGVKRSVTLAGPLFGEQKLMALGAASIFVLPSFSEGFSMAVLEAMAARLPVLITPGCNFPEAEEAAAGLQVEPTEDDTARGLHDLLALSDAERDQMGRNGRALVEREYTWERVALQMMDLYRWLLGGGQAPEWVQIS
jgi:glycosyltransferase involved in cell wall biosynthesis